MIKRIVIVIIGIAAVVLGRALFFYTGFYTPPLSKMPSYEHIGVPPSLLAEPSTKVRDKVSEKEIIILIDSAHGNKFRAEELNFLSTQLISRGLTMRFLSIADDLEKELRLADALVVILPVSSYPEKRLKLVREFVEKGGKLLLVADPARPGEVNSLSATFGLVFENGYLYNLKENDGNFCNVFISRFKTTELTKNLKKIVLYTAGGISPASNGIAFADENTLSSIMEVKGELSPIAFGSNSNVLGIYDFTFMSEPYNALYDNNQFVSNLADWLAESERVFLLSDFPHFISNEPAISYSDPSVLDAATKLRALLSDLGKKAEISQHKATLALTKSTVFVGLFKDIEAVKSYLEKANILITTKKEEKATPAPEVKKEEKVTPTPEAKKEEPKAKEEPEKLLVTLEIGGLGNVYKEGTSLIYLSRDASSPLLIILADTEAMLKETVDLLKEGEFRQWLVSDRLAICRAKKR